MDSRKTRLGFLKPLVFAVVIMGTGVSAFSPYVSGADAHSGETHPPATSTPAAAATEAPSTVETSDPGATTDVDALPDASTTIEAEVPETPARRTTTGPDSVIEIVPSDQVPADVLEAPRTQASSDAPRVNGPSTVGEATWTSTELAAAGQAEKPAPSLSTTTTSDDRPEPVATETEPATSPPSTATAETPVPELAFTGIEDVAVLGFLGNALVGLGLGALWLRGREEHGWV